MARRNHTLSKRWFLDVSELTDSTSGTTDGTVADVSTAVTGVDGTGDNAASKADVDTRLGTINDNLAELTTKYNELLDRLKADV